MDADHCSHTIRHKSAVVLSKGAWVARNAPLCLYPYEGQKKLSLWLQNTHYYGNDIGTSTSTHIIGIGYIRSTAHTHINYTGIYIVSYTTGCPQTNSCFVVCYKQ